jgi:hypothetical protein
VEHAARALIGAARACYSDSDRQQHEQHTQTDRPHGEQDAITETAPSTIGLRFFAFERGAT